jgi:hypothetical protein
MLADDTACCMCVLHAGRQAAAHSFAATYSSRYTSLSRYWIETGADGCGVLCAELHMPITVGTKGGALLTHPAYRCVMREVARAYLRGTLVVQTVGARGLSLV